MMFNYARSMLQYVNDIDPNFNQPAFSHFEYDNGANPRPMCIQLKDNEGIQDYPQVWQILLYRY